MNTTLMKNSTYIQPSDVSIIILNYKNSNDTITCLQHLAHLHSAPRRIIVVDNNSCDNSVEKILTEWNSFSSPVVINGSKLIQNNYFPSAILVTLQENDGYASGNNIGIQVALNDNECKAIWVINNDTEPHPESLIELCKRFNSISNAGIIGSTIVYKYKNNILQCAGGASLNKIFGITTHKYNEIELEKALLLDSKDVEKTLDYICGASMLIGRDVIMRIGEFEKKFFMYFEDVEYCIRAQKAGFSLGYAVNSIIYHKEGGTSCAHTAVGDRTIARPLWVDYLMLRNRIWCMKRHFPFSLPFACCSYIGVAFKRVYRKQFLRIPYVFKAMHDGLTGKMGKPAIFSL